METIESLIYAIDHSLNTKRKRHIVGGILLSVSLLFGGLSLTVMTINDKDRKEDSDEQEFD